MMEKQLNDHKRKSTTEQLPVSLLLWVKHFANIKDCPTILWFGPGLVPFPVSTKWKSTSVIQTAMATLKYNISCR